MTEEEIAHSVLSVESSPTSTGYYILEVSDTIVDRCLDWSKPVRFKFEKLVDGRVTLWMQTVDGSNAEWRPV